MGQPRPSVPGRRVVGVHCLTGGDACAWMGSAGSCAGRAGCLRPAAAVPSHAPWPCLLPTPPRPRLRPLQVHAAVLRGSNKEVVIKVLKPGVEDVLTTGGCRLRPACIGGAVAGWMEWAGRRVGRLRGGSCVGVGTACHERRPCGHVVEPHICPCLLPSSPACLPCPPHHSHQSHPAPTRPPCRPQLPVPFLPPAGVGVPRPRPHLALRFARVGRGGQRATGRQRSSGTLPARPACADPSHLRGRPCLHCTVPGPLRHTSAHPHFPPPSPLPSLCICARYAAIVGDIRASMLEEVDFTKEAAHVAQFAGYLDRAGLRRLATCPGVYRQFSSKRWVGWVDGWVGAWFVCWGW